MDLTAALNHGTAPFALATMALFLGALHGLEPGHSKTMMAAFIIAVRGTVGQAVLLGLSAAVSHTIIVWILALLALRFGEAMIDDRTESWFLIGSGVLIVMIGLWMAFRTWQATRRRRHHSHQHAVAHDHEHIHEHEHEHGHDHEHLHTPGHSGVDAEMDAHAKAHAREIHARFAAGRTTTGQTILFGRPGG